MYSVSASVLVVPSRAFHASHLARASTWIAQGCAMLISPWYDDDDDNDMMMKEWRWEIEDSYRDDNNSKRQEKLKRYHRIMR